MISINCGRPNRLELVIAGPCVEINIGFDPNCTPGQTPRPSISYVQALIDSGASHSSIDETLASQLGLPAVDKLPIDGISGGYMATIYMAQIQFSNHPFTIWGRFAGVNLSRRRFKTLIGRTFLQHFTMHYDGQTGAVTLTR